MSANNIDRDEIDTSKEKIHLSQKEIIKYKISAHPDKNTKLSKEEYDCVIKHFSLFSDNKKNEVDIYDSKFCINFIKKILKAYWDERKEEERKFKAEYTNMLKLKTSHIQNLKKIDICKATIKEVISIINLIQESNKNILKLHKDFDFEPSENFNLTATDILSEHTKLNDGCKHTYDEL
ncbi:hypothetical protein [Rickettsiales endosymbiont of Trichoplax sp. H2]|uniref:hypothetical protein n=1 Tax=Rickettsiales endosymbiont of Trichoplax sp. H2 TaxID=2021221 RepID=UPI0012B19FDC|nr:hypothetical protein [Rickettsiales endosymbiont of Trichoplax sp. H2]MSO13413.1 hypothetical protein [Rickettsiales endosymbiont of Trichoplax sp. H2]